MLAGRRDRAESGLRAAGADREGQGPYRAGWRFHLGPAVLELRVGQQVTDRIEPGVGDLRGVKQCQHLVWRVRAQHRLDFAVQLGSRGDPGRVGREPGIAGQLGLPQHLRAKPVPFAIVLHAELHRAAAAGPERPVGRDRGVAGAGPGRGNAVVHRVVHRLGHPLGQRLEQGHLQRGAGAGPFPCVQCGQDRAERVHAARDVGDRDARLGRGILGAGDRQQAGLALDQEVVGPPVTERPVRCVARDVAHDQPLVAAPQDLRRQPHPGRRAGRQVLDEHVRAVDKSIQDRPARGVLEIQAQGLLAAVEPDEVAGQALDGGVVVPREVAWARPLDLDHPGAQVGQLTGGERRGDRLLHRDHRDATRGMRGRSAEPACHRPELAEVRVDHVAGLDEDRPGERPGQDHLPGGQELLVRREPVGQPGHAVGRVAEHARRHAGLLDRLVDVQQGGDPAQVTGIGADGAAADHDPGVGRVVGDRVDDGAQVTGLRVVICTRASRISSAGVTQRVASRTSSAVTPGPFSG